ncbi:hypothetical protein COCC4DRAFT_151192 [Bipolaris maydis ATCC 48331]|uniref:Secreted protein n=2 Tax=Cochliobolus heterostrophus TaxID=5016 RepID=M2TFU3_COCH5|nr:uncharacterized protein COCC4DRAFT_151192 [Bipolaris maydis ATCC 48331]EMD85364.1 hypothetical protein COCHEDRAFT_1161494 [Bipolaris maydis C5]ENI00198.1 hypothetical protein COCC4DRAFT_151192 [Bipolaris maydis ATCC 48331]
MHLFITIWYASAVCRLFSILTKDYLLGTVTSPQVPLIIHTCAMHDGSSGLYTKSRHRYTVTTASIHKSNRGKKNGLAFPKAQTGILEEKYNEREKIEKKNVGV